MARKNQQRAMRQAAERAAQQASEILSKTSVITTIQATADPLPLSAPQSDVASPDNSTLTSKTYTAV